MTMARQRNTVPDFKAFWDAYGLKRDRIAAERAWNRLSASDRRAAVAGIGAYREDCRRRGVSMMYGQGYLSHRRWEDEPDGPSPTGGESLGMEEW